MGTGFPVLLPAAPALFVPGFGIVSLRGFGVVFENFPDFVPSIETQGLSGPNQNEKAAVHLLVTDVFVIGQLSGPGSETTAITQYSRASSATAGATSSGTDAYS